MALALHYSQLVLSGTDKYFTADCTLVSTSEIPFYPPVWQHTECRFGSPAHPGRTCLTGWLFWRCLWLWGLIQNYATTPMAVIDSLFSPSNVAMKFGTAL